MAEIDAKVNMSLDDIIKMEKKKKTANPKTKRGGAPKGTVRGGKKAGTARGGKKPVIARGSTVRGNSRSRNSRPANQGFKNKRGQWKKFPQNSTRGGFIKKKFNNGTIKSNLARSRSNLSLNKLNVNNSKGPRGGFGSHRGGKFGLTRSRSRTNLAFGNKPTFLAKNKGFLKRTNSMPNLRDPSSVYNRLGYQSPAQIAYRNRVKRAKNVLNQRQSKAMRMLNSFGLSPAGKVLSSLDRKMASSRRFTPGSLHSDQLIRTQRRAQYEQKLLRMGPEEARDLSSKMLGKMLVTKQTGPAGRICNAVMITTRMFARKELYLSVMMERSFSGPVVIASSQGGVNIEEVAESNPDAITYLPIDIRKGLSCEEAKKIAGTFGIGDADTVSTLILSLYELFVKKDALLLEINPLVLDLYGNFFALDCKCNFDDSASFRQKELFELQDWSQMDPNEARAAKFDMNYIALDGNIGCMVNGAGLAMATMDIIKLHGGEPANFLDVGGTASVEAVTEAFSIITSDPKVESVFVNIFGGIIRCDTIANGIIKACQNLNLKIPVIVRLQGTNVKEGRKLIRESNLKIININDFARAAEASVSLAQINRLAKKFDLEVEISSKPSASEETAC